MHDAVENVKAGLLGSGNHIESLQDYGGEAGGPIWKDHLWIWGAYGRDQINLITAPRQKNLQFMAHKPGIHGDFIGTMTAMTTLPDSKIDVPRAIGECTAGARDECMPDDGLMSRGGLRGAA